MRDGNIYGQIKDGGAVLIAEAIDEYEVIEIVSLSGVSHVRLKCGALVKNYGNTEIDYNIGKQTKEYLWLWALTKPFSTKAVISIDYGQEQSLFSDKRLRDGAGKVVKFNSFIDAINYMNSLGYEVLSFQNSITNTGILGSQNLYGFLLARTL